MAHSVAFKHYKPVDVFWFLFHLDNEGNFPEKIDGKRGPMDGKIPCDNNSTSKVQHFLIQKYKSC